MKKRYILLIILVLIGLLIGASAYQWIYGKNTLYSEPTSIYIPTGATYADLQQQLIDQKFIENSTSFDAVAKLMKYDIKINSGHFVLPPDLSNRDLVTILRSGKQVPVNLVISTARTIDDVVSVVSKVIEADSISLRNALMNEDLWTRQELKEASIISLIIPNTYEFFWNTDASSFVQRMEKEYDRFWNDKRQQQLEALGMTRAEVSTLASIVEKESNLKAERPTLAGVYVNRLKEDIPLQADPTVVFGIGDFTIRRVLKRHLEMDSPYNTYMHTGLPIGPICMPSISSVDAVLQAEQHDYIFFCAKPGYQNGHLFAKTNAQHERNARIYHRWLNSQGIRG